MALCFWDGCRILLASLPAPLRSPRLVSAYPRMLPRPLPGNRGGGGRSSLPAVPQSFPAIRPPRISQVAAVWRNEWRTTSSPSPASSRMPSQAYLAGKRQAIMYPVDDEPDLLAILHDAGSA